MTSVSKVGRAPRRPRSAESGTKGHFIAHSIGGAVDCAEVNVFVQLRAPNGGWSEAGKRFREMEAYCETNPGTFCFNRPTCDDQAARPAFVEFVFEKRCWRI